MATQDGDSKWIFCPDDPLGEYRDEQDDLQQDRLDFKSCAKVLAESIKNSPESITTGIYGENGAGKTTLMRMTRAVMERNSEQLITVWFNAWQYDHEENPVIPLIIAVLRALEDYDKGDNQDVSKETLEGVGALTSVLRSLLFGICVKSDPQTADFSAINDTFSSENIASRCLETAKDYVLARRLYMDAVEDLRRILRDESVVKPRLVIFIDDLDRCRPEYAIRLLQGVNQIFRHPGVSAVLGFRLCAIRSFIKEIFIKERHLEDFDPDDFLGKIIQVPFHLPETKSSAMISHIRALVDKSGIFPAGFSRDKIDAVTRLLVDVGENNPRKIIHRLNNFLISIRLAEIKKEDFEPISLFLSILMPKEHYRVLRVALEQYITLLSAGKETPIALGDVIADTLEAWKKKRAPYSEVSGIFQALAEEQTLGLVKQALGVLAQNENLCKLLSSEPALRWLKDPEFRSLYYIADAPPQPRGEDDVKREDEVFSQEEKDLATPREIDTGIDLFSDKPESESPRSAEKGELPKRIKRQEEIDPLSLLIPLTLSREQFKKLKASLDQDAMVISSDKKTSNRLSKALANTVEKGRELHENFQQTSQYILKMADFQPEGLAQKGLRMLAADPLLCQIFSTPQGVKWLRDPSSRQVNWDKLPTSRETLLELGFQNWDEILKKVERDELEPPKFLLSLILAQPIHQALRVALSQGAKVIHPQESHSYELGKIAADVLRRASGSKETVSETAQIFRYLADAQPEGLAKNALILLSEKSNLYEFLSLDSCLEWLENPAEESEKRDFPQDYNLMEQEESEIFLNEIRRKVIDDGVDPLSLPSILDDVKRNEAIPEFAKPFVRSLEPIKRMTDLSSLSLRGCAALNDITPLSFIDNLKKLDLTDCSGIMNLAPLSSLVSLEWLELTGCRAVSDLEPVAPLVSLQRLCLSGCSGVFDLNPLRNLHNLKWLDITDCRGVTDIRSLENLIRLQWLDISECSEIASVEPLRNLKNLTRLYLNGCTRLADLEPLEGVSSLKGLYLKNCARLMNLRPLVKLKSLEIIDLTNCAWLRDLSPLIDIPSLQRIRIMGTGVDVNGLPAELRDKIID